MSNTLVDAPDRHEGDDAMFDNEGQRTYKVFSDTGPLPERKEYTVRIRRDPERNFAYVIENLVGARWHRLLEGNTEDRLKIPFDKAIARAEAVLL
jgi:hypothetical protein